MRIHQFAALTLFAALAGGTGRAGSVSISAARPTVTLGQTDVLIVGINSTAPEPQPPGSDTLLEEVLLSIRPTGPASVQEFHLDLGLPAGSRLQTLSPSDFSADVQLGPNGFTSFDGPLLEFTLAFAAPGTYTFTADPTFDNSAAYFRGTDSLTSSDTATIVVRPAVVPEPAGWTLAGVCLAALAARRSPTNR